MDYLIDEKGKKTHYFLINGMGIYRRKLHSGRCGVKDCVLDGNVSAFGLFQNEKNIHILAERDGELMYLLSENGTFRKFILQNLPPDVKILNIFVYPVLSRLNMLYTAEISGEIHLMHLILSGGEKPRSLCKTKTPDFLVRDMRVYTTNQSGDSGFFELANENPRYFIQMTRKSLCPYVLCGHTAFISNGKIFFDSREIAKEENAEGIIILEHNSNMYVAWKSDDFIRYVSASDKNDKPHTIISPSRKPTLFALWQDGECYHFYGSHSDSEIITYINPSPFNYLPEKVSEVFLFRKMESMRREIEELKNELSKLA